MEDQVNRLLSAWVCAVRQRARAVLIAIGIATVAVAAFTATHLGITTHHTALLSDDLPFWKHYNAFAEVFPILDEALLVVVDAETPEQARDATGALADRLAADPEYFSSVYAPGTGEFFEHNALLYLSVEELEDLVDHLASVQPLLAELSHDRSLTNLAQVLQDALEYERTNPESHIDLAAVFDSLSLAVAAVLDGRPRPVSWTELLLQRELPGNTSRRIIVLQPVFDYDQLLPGRRVMDRVRSAAAELGLGSESGVRVRITGNVALNTEEMTTVGGQAIFAAVGTFILVGAILAMALRSRRIVFAILLTLLVGLVWTAGFAALAVGQLNIISIAFAVLFIGLGVDFGIHLAMRHAELVRSGTEPPDALEETSRSVGGSLVLCAFTTAIGFYVFVPTDYQAVAELGLISGTGMLISLIFSLTLLPALLTLYARTDVGEPWRGAPVFAEALTSLAARYPRRVRAAAAVVGVVSLCVIPYARFDHNVVAMRDASTESVQTFDELLADSDTSPWTIDVLEPDVASAQALAERLRKLASVERAATLHDYIPTDQEEKAEILGDLTLFLPVPPEEGEELPVQDVKGQIAALRALAASLSAPAIAEGDARRAASAVRAAEYLERFLAQLETLGLNSQKVGIETFEASLTGTFPDQMRRLWRALAPDLVSLENLPVDLRERMLAADGSARVQVTPREDLSDNAAHARFVDGVFVEAPHATGSAVSLLEWGRAVVRSFREALAAALVVIALLLWVLWGRVSDMMLVLGPLLLAACSTVAAMTVLGIPFNFANVVVLPLLFGIGVDSGIHLVHRHREAMARGDETAFEADLLGTSTAQAVFFSSLTTMASFGSLALSSHVGFASLGQVLLIGVTANLVCNLVVLPALIALRSPATALLVESDATA